jgi:hypothetical protein
MHGANAAQFQKLRQRWKANHDPADSFGVNAAFLPIIWDADFLYRGHYAPASGEDAVFWRNQCEQVCFGDPLISAEAIARLAASRLRDVRMDADGDLR